MPICEGKTAVFLHIFRFINTILFEFEVFFLEDN